MADDLAEPGDLDAPRDALTPPPSLALPAWGVHVAGWIHLAWGAVVVAGVLTALADPGAWEDEELPPGFTPEAMTAVVVFGLVSIAAMGLIMVAGGLAAARRSRWWLAAAGALCAIVFNAMFVCPLGPLFGVWLLVRVLRRDVRATFADQRRSGAELLDDQPWK